MGYRCFCVRHRLHANVSSFSGSGESALVHLRRGLLPSSLISSSITSTCSPVGWLRPLKISVMPWGVIPSISARSLFLTLCVLAHSPFVKPKERSAVRPRHPHPLTSPGAFDCFRGVRDSGGMVRNAPRGRPVL